MLNRRGDAILAAGNRTTGDNSMRHLFLSASTLALMLGSVATAQDRHAWYGETHVHTSWSFDAYIFGNHVTGPAYA